MTYNTKRFKRGRNATRKYYGGQLAPMQDQQMDKKEFIKHEGTLSFFWLPQLNDYCDVKVIGNKFANPELI